MEETKDQDNEVIKKRVKSKAQQDNNIDDQTAAINSEKKIVDFDYVLNNNQNLAFRINNLQKLGLGIDYIKSLISDQSQFSTGDSQTILEEEIEKVCNSLVANINKIFVTKGIVFKLDGTIDEDATEFKKAENRREHERYDPSKLLSRDDKIEILSKTTQEIKEKKTSIELDWYGRNPLNLLTRISDKELDRWYQENNLSKERAQSKNDEKELFFRTDEEINAYEAICDYEKAIGRNVPPEVEKQLRDDLKNKLKNNPSKFDDGIWTQDGEIDTEKLHEKRKEFDYRRNRSDVIRELEKYINIIDFENLPKEGKGQIATYIARAITYENDSQITALLKTISKNLNIDVTFEGIKKLLNETIFDEKNDKIETMEDLIKFNSESEFNENTYKKKLIPIRKSVKENSDIDISEADAFSKIEERKRIYENISKRLSYITITNEIEKAFSEGNKDAMLDLMSVYLKYKDASVENNKYRELVKGYFRVNRDYIEKYFRDFHDGIELFNPTSGALYTRRLEKFLSEYEPSEESRKRIEDINRKIEEYADKQDIDKNLNNEIGYIISRSKKGLIQEDEDTLVKLISNTDLYKLSDTTLKGLEGIGSTKISEVIEAKIEETLEKEGFPKEKKGNFNLSFLNVLEENVLILETKLENAKGKPEYVEILRKRNEKYKESPFYKNIVDKYRDEDGELKNEGIEKLEKYKDRLIKETVDKNFIKDMSNLSREEINRCIPFLLVGLEVKDVYTQNRCISQLKRLYPEAKDKEGTEFRDLVYVQIFGNEYKNNPQLIMEKAKSLKENVLSQTISNKSAIDEDKILDSEFDELLSQNFVDLDITAIDFSKSELQNSFNNSRVKFSEKDEQNLLILYEKYTKAAIIRSKHEAVKQRYLSTYQYVLDAENNTRYNVEPAKRQLEQMLSENPELKDEIFDENGEIRKEAIEENKKFRSNTLFSNLLSDVMFILRSQTRYEDMNPTERIKILETGSLMNKLMHTSSLTRRI